MSENVDSLTAELEAELAPQSCQDGEIEDHVPESNRTIHKFKRSKLAENNNPESVSNGVSLTSANGVDNDKVAPFSKNSKKSRLGRGRGLPKKGGAGGKGTWGALGSELYETGETSDSKDPNYDSDNNVGESVVIKAVTPALTIDELQVALQPVLQEFLENGDTEEVIESLCDLHVGPNMHKVLGIAVALALERHDPQREMTSRLISDLYGVYLSQDEMTKGFDDMLQNLEDLTIDTPNAPMLLGRFIARAVADDCLPPKFVSGYKGKLDCETAQAALNKADILLSMAHGIVRLDNVWGMGGGNRPVKYLIKRIRLLLKEYNSSQDVAEATRCLTELDVPHFSHEFVYQSILSVIEDAYCEKAVDTITSLLKSLCDAVIITKDQHAKGLSRVYAELEEISLDAPAAFSIMEALANKMHEKNIFPEHLWNQRPTTRGRKRFISEGDGGRFKEVAEEAEGEK